MQKHLPELPDYRATVTLRHLVHHASGLRDAEVGWLTGGRIQNPALIPSLSFPPGERHVYDDTGHDLLRRVIERVTGEPVGRFQRARIFEPPGMRNTTVPGVRRVRACAPDRDGGGFRLRSAVCSPSGSGPGRCTASRCPARIAVYLQRYAPRGSRARAGSDSRSLRFEPSEQRIVPTSVVAPGAGA